MTRFVTRQTMERESPGVYDTLPAQFRDRLPDKISASPQNAAIFRNGFDVFPGMINELFRRLRYVEGTEWPMWKLVACFYLVEVRIGTNSVEHTGEQIYATMPWPPEVSSVADALRSIDTAYFEAHLRAPRSLVGSWRVESESPTHLLIADDTPYPCFLNEGVVAGICHAFARQSPVYRIVDPENAKRAGGTVTHYEVLFEKPPRAGFPLLSPM